MVTTSKKYSFYNFQIKTLKTGLLYYFTKFIEKTEQFHIEIILVLEQH